jgi:RNA polymerase sigma factor (sigma-70 family)
MSEPTEMTSDGPSDSDLLTVFVARRHEPAFALIVRRHGGVVMAVCRSVLGHSQDAEDAAQAVFLTLAQRASSLQGRTTVVGWLYRVAWYVATRAAEARAVRRRHEQEVARMKPNANPLEDETVPPDVLHAALADLPEKYRLPLLLHHMEGRSERETASLLGCGVSAASVRLTRGRQMLRDRLRRRGIVGSAVGVVAVMASPVSASVQPSFVTTASQAAVGVLAGNSPAAATSVTVAALSKGALNMLFWTKLKLAAMVTVAVLLIGGAGAGTYMVLAGSAASAPTPAAPPAGDTSLSVEALKNADYRSEHAGDGRFRLVNGVHVEKESPNSATELRITLSDMMARGDLNKDGATDAAVVLVINTGGSGTFYELAAILNQNGKPSHAASAALGDRVQIKQVTIKDGEIAVRLVTQGPNDPMSSPTLEVTRRYRLDTGVLVPVKDVTPP